KSYLFGREFQIKIGSYLSNNKASCCNKGVPQGSVLSPLLFNLYIADVIDIFGTNISVKQYADDLKVYITYSNSTSHLITELQSSLARFSDWCKVNGLRISIDKIRRMHLGSSNPKHKYTIENQTIPEVTDEIRDLGLHFTPDLKWNIHINKKCRAAFFRWYNLFKFFKTN